ncbi:MAG: LysR family transcriptional regulator [Proteobacteria bacterium]|nr:LysR family transcriptional regulator [Pseudomonadota bacterium]
MVNEYQLFVLVVEKKSFSKAAETLGITQSTVSRHIDSLEERMGIHLVKRSTRKLLLTDAGEYFYEQAKQICQQIGEAEHGVRDFSELAGNPLKISASQTIAVTILPEVLVELQERFPSVRFDISTELEPGAYYRSGYELEYDIFLWEGETADTSLVLRRLGRIPIAMYAAPSYLDRCGMPKSLEEVARTGRLVGSGGSGNTPWTEKLLPSLDLTAFNFCLSTNDGLSGVAHAEAGMGFLLSAEHIVRRAIDQGTLVRLPIEIPMNHLPLNALYRREYLPPLVGDCLALLRKHVGLLYPLD